MNTSTITCCVPFRANEPGCHTAGPACLAYAAQYGIDNLTTTTTSVCFDSGGGGTTTGSGNTGNQGNGYFGGPGIKTSPILPNFEDNNNPCSELKKLSTGVLTRPALIGLPTGQTYESGYYVRKNAVGNIGPTPCDSSPVDPTKINMPIGGNIIGAMHTHPYSYEYGYDSMFSSDDINYLYQVAIKHTNYGQPKEYAEYFITLSVPSGTFALKIENWENFKKFRETNPDWTNHTRNGLSATYDKLESTYDKIGSSGFNKLQNALLKMLQENDSGIGLYKADADSNNWSRLSLDFAYTMGDKNAAPKEKPCN